MPRVTGTDGDDTYTLREGKREIVRMLAGDDTVYLATTVFDFRDRVDGGLGNDTAVLTRSGSYSLGNQRFTSFEALTLSGQGRFHIDIDDTVVGSGMNLTVSLDKHFRKEDLFIDGSLERDGSLILHAGAGRDELIGGGGADTFDGDRGDDVMSGNAGRDTFMFIATWKGDNWGTDAIIDFRSGEDHLEITTDSATSFGQLVITRTDEGTIVRTPGSSSSITLVGLLPRDLQSGDVTIVPLHHDPIAHAPAIAHDHGLLV